MLLSYLLNCLLVYACIIRPHRSTTYVDAAYCRDVNKAMCHKAKAKAKALYHNAKAKA